MLAVFPFVQRSAAILPRGEWGDPDARSPPLAARLHPQHGLLCCDLSQCSERFRLIWRIGRQFSDGPRSRSKLLIDGGLVQGSETPPQTGIAHTVLHPDLVPVIGRGELLDG